MTLLTYADIANRYGRSRSTIVNTWATHDSWPDPVDKRGRSLLFNADDVARAVTQIQNPLGTSLDGGDFDELLTLREISDITGLAVGTLSRYEAEERIPKPVGRRRMEVPGKHSSTRFVALYQRGEMADALGAMTVRHKK